MQLPLTRDFNPFRAVASTADADALWSIISDDLNVARMVRVIRAGDAAIDAIAEELCSNSLTAAIYSSHDQRRVDLWKQFAGKLVALALEPRGYRPLSKTRTRNNRVFKKGATYTPVAGPRR